MINTKSDYIFVMHKHAALFGITFDAPLYMPINYIIILTKHYIYKYRIQNKPLNLNVWKNELKFYLKIEKTIAIKQNTYEKFTEAWDKWLMAFEDDNE